jgi:hypothetical protein
MPTDSLPQFVQHYLAELRHGDGDNAFHSLIEADPTIVPLLVAEFTREPDATFRSELLRVIAEFRLPNTVAFFSDRLFDEHWKTALDFFVAQASPQAVAALEHARIRRFDSQRETDEFRAWLEEAITQAHEAKRA